MRATLFHFGREKALSWNSQSPRTCVRIALYFAAKYTHQVFALPVHRWLDASLQHVEGPGNHAEQAVQCVRAHVRLLANGDQILSVLRDPRTDQRVEVDDHETVVVGEMSSIAVQAARNEPSFVFSHKFRMVPQNFRLLQLIPVPFGCSNVASDRRFPPARPLTEQRSEPIMRTEQWMKPVARCGSADALETTMTATDWLPALWRHR